MTAAEWNKRYPIGTAVYYRPIIGGVERIETTTRSLAWDEDCGS
jgi:hypothetical protein